MSLYEKRGFAVETRYKNDVNGNGFVSARSMPFPMWRRQEHSQHLSHTSPEANFEAAMAHLAVASIGRKDEYKLASWAAMPKENGFMFIFEVKQ